MWTLRIIRLEKLDQQAALALLAELAADRPLLEKASEADRIHLYEETGGSPLLLRWIAGQLGKSRCRTISSALSFSAAHRATMTRWSSSSAICWRPSRRAKPRFSPR